MSRFRLALTLPVALLLCCTRAPVGSAIDPEMASCVPASATMVAGIDLVRLRSSPLYGKLPPYALALIEPLREARSLLAASDGKSLLVTAGGRFHQPPAGATLLADGLAISGTADWLPAAAAQYRSRRPGAPDLLADAATVAGSHAVWIALLGGRPLPLSGNAANLNRLLRNADYATIGLRLDGSVLLSATVTGRSAEAARQVEDTLRASITMLAAAEARRADFVTLLRAIQLSRDDRIVRASLSATPEEFGKLLSALAS